MAKVKKTISIESLNSKSIEIGTGKGKRRKFFLKWQAYSPSSEITRSKTFWNVWSTVEESTMLKFLRLRVFWGIATNQEMEFSMSHPKFLSQMEINVLLTALATTGLRREEIIERWQRINQILGRKTNFHKHLLAQWENNMAISGSTSLGPIGKHKAFSGWVRNSSAVGSKRSVASSIPEPLSEEFAENNFDEFEFLLKAISVGSIESNLGIIRLS